MSPSKKKPKALSHSLKEACLRELGIDLDKKHQEANWAGELSPEMIEYAATDARILLSLAEGFESKLRDAGLEKIREIEHRALPAVAWMQNAGLPFDAEGWRGYLKGIEEEVDRLVQELNELAPLHPDGDRRWNWNSHQQVKKTFSLEGIRLPNTKEETIAQHAHPLAKTLLAYRKASKVKNSFGEKFLDFVGEDGRIYASWRQIGAATGRMSCGRPNLQQLPRETIRRYVRAPEGRWIVSADYSQMELRIAARISGDERMLKAYNEGEDLHTTTARSITGKTAVSKEEREVAKAVNFGLLYGQEAMGLRNYARNVFGIDMSLQKAQRYRETFFSTYPGLKAWHEREHQEMRNGRTETRTLTGRRRTNVRNFTERVNSPVQGTGADILKLALALLWERKKECPGMMPIAAIHDEIVAECDEDEASKVKESVENAMTEAMNEVLNGSDAESLRIPIEVETKSGKTWDDHSSQPTPSPKSIEEEPIMETYSGHETRPVKIYIDYRDPSTENYPSIYACDDCAEEFDRDLAEADKLRCGAVAWCQICGVQSKDVESSLE